MTRLLVFCLYGAMSLFFGAGAAVANTNVTGSEFKATIYLAKSIKPTFNRAAAAKPPVARAKPIRTNPQPRKSAARPAPAPKGFGTRISPGGTKIGNSRVQTNTSLRGSNRAQQIATRADVRAGTRGVLTKSAFNRTVSRGALRPKFNQRAKPQKSLAASGGGGGAGKILRASSGPKNPNSLTRTFNRASRASLASPKFNRVAAPRTNLNSTFNRSLQKGHATHSFRKAAANSSKFDGGIRGGKPRIRGFTKHGKDQALKRGVSSRNLRDAVRNPGTGSKSFVAGQNKGTTKFVGRNATVVLNKQGKVVTTWPKTPKNWQPLSLN